MFPDFLVDHNTIQQRIADIEPLAYARTRNQLRGAVTHLSPFITHGVIDTRSIADVIVDASTPNVAEKLLTELGWREFFHRVWGRHGREIFTDMRHPQEGVDSDLMPVVIASANTGIRTIDDCIAALTSHGYMHNHARLWLAAVTCNVARTHWYQPARWLYYHLLDGDLASNCLSWQWVCGSFSHRKYYANQDNLNRFSGHRQRDTFLDFSYDDLPVQAVPDVMQHRASLEFENEFPISTCAPVGHGDQRVLLYSIWNLDPTWRSSDSGRRILWIEPGMHAEFALSPLRWRFIEHWARQIDGLEIFVGEQQTLLGEGSDDVEIVTREYPATAHWPGERDSRRWCYPEPDGPLKSFSSYWKPIRKRHEFFQ